METGGTRTIKRSTRVKTRGLVGTVIASVSTAIKVRRVFRNTKRLLHDVAELVKEITGRDVEEPLETQDPAQTERSGTPLKPIKKLVRLCC